MKKRSWKKTKFTKRIRISEENLEFLRGSKGRKCMAGKLNEIINKFRKEKNKS